MAIRNNHQGESHEPASDGSATELAMQMGMGFVYHDRREREAAIDAFAAVDTFQFQHVSERTAREAAEAYVDALWAKDELEAACTVDGELDREALEVADWSAVEAAFARRAELVDVDPAYAELSTTAWRRHKTGGDYWTPMQRAQMYELRAALQDDEYPHKPRDGQSGFGPEATRYVLGVELHDMRRFEEGLETMRPYFERIEAAHTEHSSDEWTV
jgi:tRNA(Leu) C34 or U34 (ribose-2'-O)-methylase TrmL